MNEKEKIAIIGTGAAGMACGHFLHNRYDLTVYEQSDHVGGHANTVTVQEADETVYTDSAFVIFNKETYPLFNRLLDELHVESIQCPMGFGFKVLETGWEYNTKGLTYIPTNPGLLLNSRFRALLWETGRFYREAQEVMHDPEMADVSIAEYLRRQHYSGDFLNTYLIPIIAVVWSIPPEHMMGFPARSLVEFLKNHGAFQGITGRRRWCTVAGGSRSYRDKLIAPFKGRIRLGCKAVRVLRQAQDERGLQIGASVTDASGDTRIFDRVILATHADQARQLLAAPTALETELLSQFTYTMNRVHVHTDPAVMPTHRYMWAGWNYLAEKQAPGEAFPRTSFSYYMNKLQRVSTKRDYFVTVNDTGRVAPERVIAEFDYEHPVFDAKAVRAQSRLPELNSTDGPLYFCGSYFRYGFHEDAFRSGVEVARAITGEPIWADT